MPSDAYYLLPYITRESTPTTRRTVFLGDFLDKLENGCKMPSDAYYGKTSTMRYFQSHRFRDVFAFLFNNQFQFPLVKRFLPSVTFWTGRVVNGVRLPFPPPVHDFLFTAHTYKVGLIFFFQLWMLVEFRRIVRSSL